MTKEQQSKGFRETIIEIENKLKMIDWEKMERKAHQDERLWEAQIRLNELLETELKNKKQELMPWKPQRWRER